MKSSKKIFFACLFAALLTFSVSAKDSVGIGLQFGALGSEKTFSSSATISGNTISIPFTKTTFNPNIHVDINVPVCDINEIVFFGINPGYDFSWDFSYSNSTSAGTASDTTISYEHETYVLSHRFSLIPAFTFVVSNFRFSIGTGFALGVELYRTQTSSKTTASPNYTYVRTYNEYTDIKVFWALNAGLKYKLGKHIFVVTDISFFVEIYDSHKVNNYTIKTSGNSSIEVLPKIGVMFAF